MEIRIIPLAQKKIERRGISSSSLVEETIRHPEQIVPGYGERAVHQRRYTMPGRKEQLLRVVCEQSGDQIVVVTAYLTSEIHRYWRA